MTMMISKFNRMIQSKLIWGIILVVIVMSFVVWGMAWPSNSDEDTAVNAAGMLDGEPVSHSEYRSAYLSTYMARSLALGREIPSTPENDEILRTLTWRRIATLHEAAKLGVVATDEEVIGAIRSNFTDENGTYNPQRYQAFLQGMIAPMGFTAPQFENHLREEIISQKMGALVGRQAIVTPLEVERTYNTLMDSFLVDYVSIDKEAMEKSVKVDEKAIREAYDEDPELFTIPEQRKVKYAAFTIADFEDPEQEFSEDDILDYYDLNIEEFTSETENEDGSIREEVAELEDVRDDIVKNLRLRATLAKVDEAAAELIFRAVPGRDGRIPDFDEQAKASGLTVESIPPFTQYETPVEDAGIALAMATFQMELNPYDRISTSPVLGEEKVYVLYLEDILEPRVPDFEEAKEQAETLATQRAVAKAIQEKAEAVQKAAEDGLAAGKTFAAAVAGEDLAVETAEEFTGLTGSSSSNLVVQALVQSVVSYNQGEVTDPILGEDGVLIAYVLQRTPADPLALDTYQAEIANAIRSRRAQEIFREWQAGLLSADRFTDLQRPVADDEIEEMDIEVEETAEEPA